MPEDKKEKVTITPDTILANTQGMQMGVKVTKREAPTLIVMEQYGTVPFAFNLNLHIRPLEEGCELQLELDAELSMMIKMMLKWKAERFCRSVYNTIGRRLEPQVSKPGSYE